MLHPSAPSEPLAALAALLRTPCRIAVTTHFNPDGDAMGSALAWARVLQASGHAVQVVLPNTAPGNLRWMPGYNGAMDHSSHGAGGLCGDFAGNVRRVE